MLTHSALSVRKVVEEGKTTREKIHALLVN